MKWWPDRKSGSPLALCQSGPDPLISEYISWNLISHFQNQLNRLAYILWDNLAYNLPLLPHGGTDSVRVHLVWVNSLNVQLVHLATQLFVSDMLPPGEAQHSPPGSKTLRLHSCLCTNMPQYRTYEDTMEEKKKEQCGILNWPHSDRADASVS